MEQIMMLILGLFITALGCVNISGNISTIHWYQRRKVREEDVPKYGRAVGAGTVVIGAALVVSYFVAVFGKEALTAFILIPAVAIGLALLLYAQLKYNKGIF